MNALLSMLLGRQRRPDRPLAPSLPMNLKRRCLSAGARAVPARSSYALASALGPSECFLLDASAATGDRSRAGSGAEIAAVGGPWVRTRSFAWPLAALVLVSLAAALANRGHDTTLWFTIGGCLLFPLLGRPRIASGAYLAWRREGWLPAVALALAAVLIPNLAVVAWVKLGLGALFLHPSLADGLGWMALRGAALLPLAAAEEWFFRGWLQQSVLAPACGGRRLGCVSAGTALAAAAFALAHVVALGSPLAAVTAFPGGLVLGWLVERSRGSLWPAALLHLAANFSIAWVRLLAGMNFPPLSP